VVNVSSLSTRGGAWLAPGSDGYLYVMADETNLAKYAY
jgi:hypothetical protein